MYPLAFSNNAKVSRFDCKKTHIYSTNFDCKTLKRSKNLPYMYISQLFLYTPFILFQEIKYSRDSPKRVWQYVTLFILRFSFDSSTLQMFYMQFLQTYVCEPNPQTTLSNFNSLKPVIKKRQFNAVFTVFQKGFLHVFVCNF